MTFSYEGFLRYTPTRDATITSSIALTNGISRTVFPNTDYDITIRVKGVTEGLQCRVTLGRTDSLIYDKTKDGTGSDLIFLISNISNLHASEGYALGIIVNNPSIPTGNAIISWAIITNPLTLGASTLMGAFDWLWRIKQETQVLYSPAITFHVYDNGKVEYTPEQLATIRVNVEEEAVMLHSPISAQNVTQAGADFAKNITDFFGAAGNALAPYVPYIILGLVVIVAGPALLSSTVKGIVSGGRS